MQAIKTIGLDIAKSVFQVHGVDAEGNVIIRRRLKRRYVLAFFQKVPPCLRSLAIRTAWLRELVGLRKEDVSLDPPIPFIYIRPHEKLGHSLKTPGSERVAPLLFSILGCPSSPSLSHHLWLALSSLRL